MRRLCSVEGRRLETKDRYVNLPHHRYRAYRHDMSRRAYMNADNGNDVVVKLLFLFISVSLDGIFSVLIFPTVIAYFIHMHLRP